MQVFNNRDEAEAKIAGVVPERPVRLAILEALRALSLIDWVREGEEQSRVPLTEGRYP